MAADDYDCLREDYYLDLNHLSRTQLNFRLLSTSIKCTAMSRLIFGLKVHNKDSCSLLDIDGVPGVDWNNLFSRTGFSELHKIVYGISSRSLDAEIEARPEELDRPDSLGLTPLWYACWLGDSNHLHILIRHGADVNSASIPPICAAAWNGSYELVKQLLNAGALIRDEQIDCLYQTLMSRPSLWREDVGEILAIDKALFGRFLNINYRFATPVQTTPLIALVWQQLTSHSLPRMRQLLELGADTELCDELGMTPLCHAICTENAEACKVLGRAGANANVQNQLYGTILHTAIRSIRYPDTILAISELDLSGIDLGAKDNSGCTAFELFMIRAGKRRNNNISIVRLHSTVRFPSSPWYFSSAFKRVHTLICSAADLEIELDVLWSFQTLLQQVQEAQGIPIEDRYPFPVPFESTRCIQINGGSSVIRIGVGPPEA